MTPEPQYGFTICQHEDPQRSHFWDGSWLRVGLPGGNPHRTYQKPIPLPDGFDLVPEGEVITQSDRCYCVDVDRWHTDHNWAGEKAIRKHGCYTMCFARRKPAKTEEKREGWILCSERLPDSPQRVIGVNHGDRKAHATTWDGKQFVLNPKPYAWMPIPPVPEPPKSPAEKAWEEWAKDFPENWSPQAVFLAGFEKGRAK